MVKAKMAEEDSTQLTGLDQVLGSLQLEIKAKKGRENTFSKYKYRSGEDILAAVKEELKKDKYPRNCRILSDVGLELINNRLFVYVKAILKVGNESEEAKGYAEHGVNKKGMDEAQLTGSTTTYAKKYALQNLLAIDESEDDIDAKDNRNEGSNKSPSMKNLVEGFKEDMGELCEKKKSDKAEEFFKIKKKEVETCGSVDEVEAMFEDGKILKKLSNYPKLSRMLEDCKKEMIKILDPESQEEANYIQAG